MSSTRPKFCVGEEVMLRSVDVPSKNSDRTEVINMDYDDLIEIGYSAWGYQLSHTGDAWWDESALRKLPPEERTSWEDCMWQPDKDGICAEQS